MQPLEKLKELRKANGYTQEDMSKMLGISRAAYAEIEAGDRNPSLRVIIKILGFFNVRFEELYTVEPIQTELHNKYANVKRLTS